MNPSRSTWPCRFCYFSLFSFLFFGVVLCFPPNSFSNDAPEQFQKGIVALQEGRLLEAEAVFRSILEKQPDNLLALFNLGNVLMQRQQYREAKERFRKVLKFRPDFVEGHLHLAQIDRIEGDLEGAFYHYFEAYWLSPIDSSIERFGEEGMTAILIEGEVKESVATVQKAVQEGRVAEAEGKLREVLEIAPESAQLWNLLGIVTGIEGRYDEAMRAFQKSVRIQPTFSSPWIRMGELLELQGKFTEARDAYETAIILEAEPEGSQVEQAERSLRAVEDKIDLKELLDRGDELFNKGEFETAIRVYQVALERYPNEGTTYLKIGMTFGRLNRINEALRKFEKAIEKNPGDIIGRIRIGQILEAMRLFGRAERSYSDALARAGNGQSAKELRQVLIRLEERRNRAEQEARILLAEGKEKLSTGNREEGLKLLQQASSLYPENPEVHALLFSLYEAQGNIDAAINALQGVLEFDPSASWVHGELARLYGKKGFYGQALKELDKTGGQADQRTSTLGLKLQQALSKANERQRPFLEQARHLRLQRDFAGAYKEAQKAILERPDDPIAHSLLAEIYSDRGELAKAREEWEMTSLLDPLTASAVLGLAKTLEKGGALSEAREAYQNALRLLRPDEESLEREAREGFDRVALRIMNSSEARLFFRRGLRRMEQGDYAAAEEAFRAVVFYQPDNAAAHYQLAVSQQRQSKLTEAQSQFQQAIRLNPNFAPSRVFLGKIYLEQERLQEAIDQFDVAQRLLEGSGIPEEEQVDRTLAQLKRRYTLTLSQNNTYDSNASLSADPADDFYSTLSLFFNYYLYKGSRLVLPVGLSSDNVFGHISGQASSNNAFKVFANSRFSENLVSSLGYTFRYLLAAGGIAGNSQFGSVDLTYKRTWPGTMQLHYDYRNFTSFLNSNFNSSGSTIRISVTKYFFERDSISVSYSLSENNVNESSLSTDTNAGSISYTHGFSPNLTGLLGYELSSTRYLEPNLIQEELENELVNRKNTKHVISATLVYKIVENVSISSSMVRIWNKSNLRNFASTDPDIINTGHPIDEGPYERTLVSATVNLSF